MFLFLIMNIIILFRNFVITLQLTLILLKPLYVPETLNFISLSVPPDSRSRRWIRMKGKMWKRILLVCSLFKYFYGLNLGRFDTRNDETVKDRHH